jgi:rod shape determining protein RodA
MMKNLMRLSDIKVLFSFDVYLVAPMAILIAISLTVLYSLGLGIDGNGLGNFYNQLFFIPVGLFVFGIVSFVNYRWYYQYAPYLYIAGALLLIIVLLFGTTIRGTTGWLNVGIFYVQPVEIVKVFWVIWLAYFFVKTDFRTTPIRTLFISILYLGILVSLIAFQPDFGSAMLLVATWGIILLLLAYPKKYLAALFVGFFALLFFSWFFLFADYQKERIGTFFNPQADPLGSGYNVRQSIIAVGSGQLWGRGIGEGTQSHLRFLPESQTDFIFAVIGEELGFIGLIIVVASWLVIFWRIYSIGIRSDDNFSSVLLAGIMAWLFTQLIINIGMNVGLLPVTGIGLPLVSYGRSSLLVTFIALGIVMNISRSARDWRFSQVR